MIRTQVYLTTKESEELLSLSKELRLHKSALIRAAIDQFIERKQKDKQRKKEAIHAASGLWANRKDLVDFKTLRSEWDRI